MKRYLTLGFSLCLLSFLSGCCCGGVRACGFRRARGGCNPCGGPAFAPPPVSFGGSCGSCNPCNTGMAPDAGFYGGMNGGPAPMYGQPGAFYQPNGFGTADMSNGIPTDTAGLPIIPTATTSNMAYPDQFGQSQFSQSQYGPPVTTALSKPESLATY